MAAASLNLPDCSDSEAGAQPEEAMEEELALRPGDTYPCQRKDGTYHDAEVVKVRMNKQSGQEEYFVHYVGLPRRQAEWVDKSQLMLSKPVKADNADNGADRKRTGNEETSCEKEEPELKKVKVDTAGVLCKDEAYVCILCYMPYQDQVMVECGCSFCRSCIDKAWEDRDSLSCPKCNKLLTEKKATDNLLAQADLPKTLGNQFPAICLKHDEKLTLYCNDDGELGCIICQDSLKHQDHKFLPFADAVDVYRAELSNVVSPLEEAWGKTSEQTDQQSEKIRQHSNTVSEYRQHIMSEFANMYNFLKEQKEEMLKQLHEQSQGLQEEMETNAAKIEESRYACKETIAIAKQKMDETDPFSFLDDISEFLSKSREQLEALKSSGHTVVEKEICRATFRGPIQYSIWKKMKSIVPVTSRHSEWLVKFLLSKPAKDDNLKEERSEEEAAKVTEPLKKLEAQPLGTCPDHDEQLNLYCMNDGSLGCIICQDSLKHNGHKFLPVMDAVEMYKTQLSSIVSPLEEAWKKASNLTIQQSEAIGQVQKTMTDYLHNITADFGSLHQFLKEQRNKLLRRLREEGESLLKALETNAARMVEDRDASKVTLATANQKVEELDPSVFLYVSGAARP